ncbi:MAG: tRNA 2-thiouridine(34) synthase MnmA [Geobacter sp.]|nr:tRNA 2-thiouridine(34) synthase MnmA [Geobacter sp.]
MSKIAVAMSGGVDSSVVAALLQQQGHEVIGITMQLFEPCSSGPGTPAHDGAQVAAQLGIPHHLLRLEPQFRDLIIDNFIDQYRQGQTPNPCILCNRQIKFGLLLEKARELGADLLATGHYVRTTVDPDGLCHLRPAANRAKDQSYFLYSLSQQQLRQVLFPLGEIASKDEVRSLAAGFGLSVATKGDSQEVCFIPNDDYIAFLESQGLTATAGKIVHLDGTVLGRHFGTHRYTIGQRKGLGIGWREPLYVLSIDTTRNLIVVGEQQLLLQAGLLAADISWIIPPPGTSFNTTCKIRYRHQPVPCRVELLIDDQCRVLFDEPQRSVTPGQFVVFYQDDQVLGGGRIHAACTAA